MLPRTTSTGVNPIAQAAPVVRTDRAGDPRQEAFQRTLATMLGTPLRAAVLSRLNDGSFLVRVAATPVRMMLPPGTRVGSELSMTAESAFPQPTLRLAGEALPAALAAWRGTASTLSPAATLLGKAPLTPATLLPQLGSDTASATLSQAARMLADVIHTAQAVPGAPAPATAVSATAPLVAAPPAEPAQLAQQLQKAITQSGLFYESHVAQWAEGKRSMADLAAEPQMQQRPASPATDPASAQFVNLQLASHEHAHIAWQGQLGPGQRMEWAIDKDAPQQPADGEPGQPAWRSGLRLRFALLGEIAATVTLRGDQLQIELRTGSEGTGAALRARAAQLTDAMDAAGVPLSSLRIGAVADPADD
jgi:hypothetical protein